MKNLNTDILTVDEAADLLKIPRSSVYKLAQEGKIPAQKVGRHWRFYRPSLLSWISKGAYLVEKSDSSNQIDFS